MARTELIARSVRRRVRLRASIRVEGEREIAASVINVSVSGVFLRVEPRRLEGVALLPGAPLELRLMLPGDAEAVVARAEIVWTNSSDRELDGRVVTGIGLRFVSLERTGGARLSQFIDEFRYAVLVLDSEARVEPVRQALGDGFRVFASDAADDALKKVATHDISVIVVGETLGFPRGLALLRELAAKLPQERAGKIIVYDTASSERVLEFLRTRAGGCCLREPYAAEELRALVQQAVDAYALGEENDRLREELALAVVRLQRENTVLRHQGDPDEFGELLGTSAAMLSLVDHLERVRHTDASVHLRGATGTGKELVARALHHGSQRARGVFLTQSCAGLNETLLQSVLFGHVRGAFSGATSDHPGVFRAAEGGTLLLDEISAAPANVQASLLRVLQDGEIVPLGAAAPVRVDVRLVSATRIDLEAEVRAGRFREELYYRLVVLTIDVPPLRARAGDVALLAKHFLDLFAARYRKHVAGFSTDAARALERYDWPGNVRELKNEVERLVVLARDGDMIGVEMLSPSVRTRQSSVAANEGIVIPRGLPFDVAMEQLERTMIEEAMERSGGVASRAAELLGMERTRLLKHRRRWSQLAVADARKKTEP